MPSFCVSCGSPLGGQSGFCANCGARAGHPPSSQPAVVATPSATSAASTTGSGGSALKIVLIVVGVLFVFGALSLGGMYYAAHRYIKMAEDVTGIKAGDAIHSIREAASRTERGAGETKRDGCALLSKDEASAILGIEVVRVDGKPNEQQSGEHCDFFIKPGSVEQHEERLKQSAAAVNSDPGSASKANELPPGALDMIKNMARSAVEAARNGEAPYFGFKVDRENGKIVCSALGVATRLGGGDLVGKTAEPLGVGDEATMGIGESLMCVVKGDAALTLDFTQVTGARGKGIALAKTILPRL
jgi:hypothetical protein